MPFDDASFDVVVANNIVHHWPDIAAGLTESHRVLRPGGKLAVAFGDHGQNSAGIDNGRLAEIVQDGGFDAPTVLPFVEGTLLLSDRR